MTGAICGTSSPRAARSSTSFTMSAGRYIENQMGQRGFNRVPFGNTRTDSQMQAMRREYDERRRTQIDAVLRGREQPQRLEQKADGRAAQHQALCGRRVDLQPRVIGQQAPKRRQQVAQRAQREARRGVDNQRDEQRQRGWRSGCGCGYRCHCCGQR